MSAMIEVHDLRKRFGAFEALRGISATIGRGEIVGFLGPNGAGKSTTMKILTGFYAPTAGSAQVAGLDVVTESFEVRRKIGYLPESAPIYADMRVGDYLDFIGRIRGMGDAERAAGLQRAAEECDIVDRLTQRVGTLSKGYRQRVGLAQALLHEPPILILDEPTSGLDPNQILAIRNLIRRIGASRTVLLSTHILQEVQATCDRVIILNRGEIVADAPTDEVRTGSGSMVRVSFTAGAVKLSVAAIAAALQAIPGVTRVTNQAEDEPGVLPFEVLSGRDVRAELFELAVGKGLRLVELSRAQSTLEEVFRRLTQEPGHALTEPSPEGANATGSSPAPTP